MTEAVFSAQLIGTVELLEEDEREMVKGLIINKFRGDKTILDPGVQMLEERSHIPVVGVAPYLDIQVEDEDSLTERFDRKQEVDLIDIAVIRVPRISNFTDFNPLESIPGVSLRYVQHVSELKNPDMIILPGTKNTMEDLLWMRANGLEAAVLKEAAKGKIIFGICGGYQMLGETLSDPHHVEAGGTTREWDCFLWILFLQKRKPEPEFPADSWNSGESFRHCPVQNWRVTRSIWEKLC